MVNVSSAQGCPAGPNYCLIFYKMNRDLYNIFAKHFSSISRTVVCQKQKADLSTARATHIIHNAVCIQQKIQKYFKILCLPSEDVQMEGSVSKGIWIWINIQQPQRLAEPRQY